MTAEHGLSLRDGVERAGVTYEDLWLRQLALGGEAGSLEVEAYVLGLLIPDAHQHDVIAQALNECFLERGGDHPVAYWQNGFAR